MATLPERIKQLDVHIGPQRGGRLLSESQFVFSYDRDGLAQPALGLLMPPSRMSYRSAALFPVMDQNLPEGYLFNRIRELFPKQPLTPMHLLALIGTNGIGRLGFTLPDAQPVAAPRNVSRADLLHSSGRTGLFEELVQAYLSTGIGVAGVQPKILVPARATFTVPNLIVKAASPAYPGLAANEYLCLRAARHAGIEVPEFELSDDGQLLLIERFDLDTVGGRIGFEDIASLMGLQVRDILSDRKYHGSYEAIAEVLRLLNLPAADLRRFYAQVALTVMVRNGDGHLKNFGVLYTSEADVRLSPLYDVVTTAIYKYQTVIGAEPQEDHTLALKLFKGAKSKRYPVLDDLLRFGSRVCGVTRPIEVLQRIGTGMTQAMTEAKNDPRIPVALREQMADKWARGWAYLSH